MNNYLPVGHHIKTLIAAHGLLIKDFAAIVGFEYTHISRVLGGYTTVSPQLAYAIQQNFDVDAVELLTIQARWQITQIDRDGLAEHRTKGNKGKKIQLDEDKVIAAARGGTSILAIARDNDVSYGVIWRFLRDKEIPVDVFGGKDRAPKPRKDTRPVVAPRRT